MQFRCRALFVGPNVRAAINEGRADYVPVHLHQAPRLFRDGTLPLDDDTLAWFDFVIVSFPKNGGYDPARLTEQIVEAGLAKSNGAARRLIAQGGVSVDGERINEVHLADALGAWLS